VTRTTVDAGASVLTLRALFEAYAAQPDVRTVAVVGNAPLEASARRAAAIDEADLVIRVNGLRTDVGAEPTVGVRTDVVFFQRRTHSTPWLWGGYRRRLYVAVQADRLYWPDYRVPSWWPSDLGFVLLDNELVLEATHQLGTSDPDRILIPTTGTLAAWTAITLFPEADVRLAGFSMLDDPNPVRWDHAAGSSTVMGWMHDLHKEKLLMERWISDGRARLI
jgi:hypothetical protein